MLPVTFSLSLPVFLLSADVCFPAPGAPLEKYPLYSGDFTVLQTQGCHFLNLTMTAQGNWQHQMATLPAWHSLMQLAAGWYLCCPPASGHHILALETTQAGLVLHSCGASMPDLEGTAAVVVVAGVTISMTTTRGS